MANRVDRANRWWRRAFEERCLRHRVGGNDTSPRFGCCTATEVAIRELAANAAASLFSVIVFPVLQPVVPVWELVDSAERPVALIFLPLN